MAAGSVLIRIWSVLIVGALLAVASDPAHARFAWLAVFMAITFWLLDAQFLRQRRLFRKLVDRVRDLPDAEVDFLLDTSAVDTEADAIRSLLFSGAPLLFHGAVIGSIAVARWMWGGG